MRGKYADDGSQLSLKSDGTAHYIAIASKLTLPQTMAQEYDCRTTHAIFAAQKNSADVGGHAKFGEEIGGNPRDLYAYRIPDAREVHAAGGLKSRN